MEYLRPLVELFSYHANAENASAMQKYMRDHFVFYGIKSPRRKSVSKFFLKKFGLPQVEQALWFAQTTWKHPQREMQYFGMETLEKLTKKIPQDSFQQIIEHTTTHKSWWDTVDFVASHLAGKFFKAYPAQIAPVTEQWMATDNLWLQRVCLLFQLSYKDKVNEDLLFGFAKSLSGSKEFFIQKAIGWALRQHAKTAPESVQEFVARTPLAKLSQKEALKHLQ
ncbi:hypothetical protein BKI52_21765 [marine bacterium AO1-C]|nr:hypothetical protein BKI52_21765 [marine bacterium AO1-C]